MKNILFIMPFGKKQDINFDTLYEDLSNEIKKLNKKVNVYRVDKLGSTNIDAKMFKGIIAADIVVADISTANSNVFYELGVRHSFAEKTTKLIMNKNGKIPFDINHLNVQKYTLNNNNKINEISKICNSILKKENEKDSMIFKTLEDLKRRPINKNYMKVFDEWTSEYNKFNEKIKKYENSEKYEEGLKYLKKLSFKNTFEPYATKLALFTYKKNENDVSSLSKALKIINKLHPSSSSSSEVLGLSASIHNRLFKLSAIEAKKVEKVNKLFYFGKKTVYSYGTYLMSRIYLSSKKYSKKPSTYLSKSEVRKSCERMKNEYPSIENTNERDLKFFEETKLLIDYALGKKIYENKIKNDTSKNSFKEIKEWLDETKKKKI